ncbi:hypothetical protein JIR23_33035 [Bradyrhizobium diazoefficiens]|nr:hypothetical protein [Bradyrhizobium diazoefficiens]QQN64242.1 hypothetical protein JIR23_33035 [Bradyrhizobium diazoefficiens]
MKRAILAAGIALLSMAASVQAEPFGMLPLRRPFVETLSNTTPLAFGMDAEQTSHALGQPLQYVKGRHGNEIYLALRNIGGSGLIPQRHRLVLQFRHGRLAGWKEDYGENWMWE